MSDKLGEVTLNLLRVMTSFLVTGGSPAARTIRW